jgi:hypothetical protein
VRSQPRRGRRADAGFVAVELVLGIGLLVLPVALLVLTLPGWSERQSTARSIAREVARDGARASQCDLDRARALAAMMAENLGLPGDDVQAHLDCPPGVPLDGGTDLAAEVTVKMPAVQVPLIGAVGEWDWTARHREPVDRYGSAP